MKSKRNKSNDEFCKRYLTPDWDGCAANDYFARKVNVNLIGKFKGKGPIEVFKGLYQIELAENNVYSNIAHLAFEKDRLVSFLKDLISQDVLIPKDVDDEEKYRSSFLSTARTILDNINNEKYDFQKSKS